MAKINPMPPLELLRQRFSYCADTGSLQYAQKVSQRRVAGSEAGSIHYTGYRYVKLRVAGQVVQIAVHRIAWAFANGHVPDPAFEIDHIDRDRLNNRASNLRLVTRQQNANNTARSGRSDLGSGVTRRKRNGRWLAQPNVNGRIKYLGSFGTREEAAAAVLRFRQDRRS